MLEKRKAPYVWPTWISGLLSGEDHCRWATWVKVHFKYDKRPNDGGDALSRWMTTHDDLLKARAEELTGDGWAVTIEAQNKFTVRGRTATIGGMPDIIAIRRDDCLISDAKGGKRKHKYLWQLREYMVLVPLVNDAVTGKRMLGELVYPDGREVVTLEPGDTERIYAQIADIGEGPEPRPVPSQAECQYCDVSECDVRFVGASAEGGAGGRF